MGIREKNCKGFEGRPGSKTGQGLDEEKVCIKKPAYIHSTESQAKDIILQKDVETTSDITRLLGPRACIIFSVGEN